jgi:imidazolonepropionase-like amidohydrolase
MRPRTTRPIRRATGLIAAVALALAACGSDGDAGGGDDEAGGVSSSSTEAFCEAIQALAESSDDTSGSERLASLQSVADAAPDEISSEMDELVAGFEQVLSFDPEAASEEEMTDFLAMADGLDGAGTAVEEFALENCPDLPADVFATE